MRDISAPHRISTTARTGFFEPQAAAAYGVLVLLWPLLAVVFFADGLTLDGADTALLLGVFGTLIAIGWLLRIRRLSRLADAVEAYALFCLVCLTFTLVGIVVARHGASLADGALAKADRVLFPWWDWGALVTSMADHQSPPMTAANVAYGSIAWQPPLLIALTAWRGRAIEVWAFLKNWVVCLAIVMAIFALMPALGAYAHFAVPHDAVPAIWSNVGWHQPSVILALRSGALRHIDTGTLEGLVSFPSFHTAAAILLSSAFWQWRALRWPMLGLNAAMVLAAVPCGGHYLVDILAGGAVAALTLGLTSGRLPRLAGLGNTARTAATATSARASMPPAGRRFLHPWA